VFIILIELSKYYNYEFTYQNSPHEQFAVLDAIKMKKQALLLKGNKKPHETIISSFLQPLPLPVDQSLLEYLRLTIPPEENIAKFNIEQMIDCITLT